jgi:hypothetical protein
MTLCVSLQKNPAARVPYLAPSRDFSSTQAER